MVAVSACFMVASLTGAALQVAARDTTATPVPFGAAVFATAAAGGIALVLARLAGRAHHPRRTFLLLTMAGLLASAIPPLQAATTVSTAIWLLIMHAVAALALVPVVASGLPSTRPVDEREPTPHGSAQVTRSAPMGGNAPMQGTGKRQSQIGPSTSPAR